MPQNRLHLRMIAVVNISDRYESQGKPLMRFEAQTIVIRDQHQVVHPLPAMVGVQDDGAPTGLAYHLGIRSMEHDPIAYEDWYSLTHLASGLCVSWDPSVKDEATAHRWLELIASLADWTQPGCILKQHASRLQEQVEVACRQACAEQQAGEQKREEVKTAATLGGVFPGNACL